MTDYRPRLFASDADVVRVGEGLLARDLPRDEWTHEAHLAATAYLLLRHPEVDLDRELPGMIRRYNESVGGVNSETEGYHETITRVFLHGIRLFLSEVRGIEVKGTVPSGRVPGACLHDVVNELLLSPMGAREWPLRFYSPGLLFSVEARRSWVAPDLSALP